MAPDLGCINEITVAYWVAVSWVESSKRYASLLTINRCLCLILRWENWSGYSSKENHWNKLLYMFNIFYFQSSTKWCIVLYIIYLFMYDKNKIDYNTDPSGKSWVALVLLEHWLSILVYWSLRNLLKQLFILHLRGIFWLTVSNAFWRLINTPHAYNFLPKAACYP